MLQGVISRSNINIKDSTVTTTVTSLFYLAGASAIFLPFYHCVIAYFLLFIYLGYYVKSVTSSFWFASQFEHPVLITAWAIDSSNILYTNEALLTTLSKSVAFLHTDFN